MKRRLNLRLISFLIAASAVCCLPLTIAVGYFAYMNFRTAREMQASMLMSVDQHAKNKYPIILHHGIMPVSGMHKFALFLRAQGYNVYSTQVPAINSIESRAKELKDQVDLILKKTGFSRANLIAHSMGGLDARFMISQLGGGDKVVSLTTVATPHQGSQIADFYVKHKYVIFATFLEYFAATFIHGSHFGNVDAKTGCKNLTTHHMQGTFNEQNPDHPHVYYQSFAGNCTKNTLWSFDPFLYGSCFYLQKLAGVNDGVVAVDSAKWGRFRGVIDADHFQLIHAAVNLYQNEFDAYKFFQSVSADLVSMGY